MRVKLSDLGLREQVSEASGGVGGSWGSPEAPAIGGEGVLCKALNIPGEILSEMDATGAFLVETKVQEEDKERHLRKFLSL